MRTFVVYGVVGENYVPILLFAELNCLFLNGKLLLLTIYAQMPNIWQLYNFKNIVFLNVACPLLVFVSPVLI